MKKYVLITCLLISACASPEEIEARQQAQLQADRERCTSYGFHPRSDGFRNCLLQLDIARQQRYYYPDPYYPRFNYGLYQHIH